MTALAHDRNTPSKEGRLDAHPVAASTRIYAGSLVMLDAAGNAAGATTAVGLKPAGRAEEHVDNTDGAAGDRTALVRRGEFLWANDGSVTRANIGAAAYAVDDQTVAASDGGGTRSACGTIRNVSDHGVWVEI